MSGGVILIGILVVAILVISLILGLVFLPEILFIVGIVYISKVTTRSKNIQLFNAHVESWTTIYREQFVSNIFENGNLLQQEVNYRYYNGETNVNSNDGVKLMYEKNDQKLNIRSYSYHSDVPKPIGNLKPSYAQSVFSVVSKCGDTNSNIYVKFYANQIEYPNRTEIYETSYIGLCKETYLYSCSVAKEFGYVECIDTKICKKVGGYFKDGVTSICFFRYILTDVCIIINPYSRTTSSMESLPYVYSNYPGCYRRIKNYGEGQTWGWNYYGNYKSVGDNPIYDDNYNFSVSIEVRSYKDPEVLFGFVVNGTKSFGALVDSNKVTGIVLIPLGIIIFFIYLLVCPVGCYFCWWKCKFFSKIKDDTVEDICEKCCCCCIPERCWGIECCLGKKDRRCQCWRDFDNYMENLPQKVKDFKKARNCCKFTCDKNGFCKRKWEKVKSNYKKFKSNISDCTKKNKQKRIEKKQKKINEKREEKQLEIKNRETEIEIKERELKIKEREIKVKEKERELELVEQEIEVSKGFTKENQNTSSEVVAPNCFPQPICPSLRYKHYLNITLSTENLSSDLFGECDNTNNGVQYLQSIDDQQKDEEKFPNVPAFDPNNVNITY